MEEQVQPVVRKKRKARKRAFKASRFDGDAIALVRSGTASLREVSSKLGVDYADAKKRFELLVEKGYLIQDGENAGLFRLGVEGYNKYAPKKAPEHRKEAAVPEQRAQGDFDLGELLKQGAPQPSLKGTIPYLARPGAKAAQGPKQKSLGELIEEGKPLKTENGSEKCELCKGAFKVSVSDASQAKYGHCFCGAAYHKDCYDSLADQGGRCFRCGKKLSLIVDRSTEDAVKGIKDAFE